MRQVRSNPDFGQFVGAGGDGDIKLPNHVGPHVFLHFLES